MSPRSASADGRGKPLPRAPTDDLNGPGTSSPTITLSPSPSVSSTQSRYYSKRRNTASTVDSLAEWYRGEKNSAESKEQLSRDALGLGLDTTTTASPISPLYKGTLSPWKSSSPGSFDPSLLPSMAHHELKDSRFAANRTGPVREYPPSVPHSRSSSFAHHPLVDSPTSEYSEHKGSSVISSFDGEVPRARCPSKRSIYQRGSSFLAVTNLTLAIYATVLSGLWLFVALTKPRYGRFIQSHGSLTPAGASAISALFAKTIELSSTTVYVTMLGQVFSRRLFVKRSKGITIAEMTMRSWIMQPGTLLTHWSSVRYAYISFLGIVGLTTAFMTMMYTVASDSLVSPALQFGSWEQQTLYGKVSTSYANPEYVAQRCLSPTKDSDPEFGGSTCVAIEHAGQAYHDYLRFLERWTGVIATGNGSDGLREVKERPKPMALLFDNTTVEGSWIEAHDMKSVSESFDRIINNITMAMPHPGVFAAAQDPTNNILQPEELGDLGQYKVRAGVPSPAVNVLCAAMTKDDLKPLVVEDWPNFNKSEPAPADVTSLIPPYGEDEWLNKTAVDTIFSWGEEFRRRPPVFSRYPSDFNTILNISVPYGDTFYLLAKSATAQTPYMLCSMRSFLSPNCSTRYLATRDGGELKSHCEDDNDPQSYNRVHPEAPVGRIESDWKNIASEWGLSLALNAGMLDGNASNARLLTQLIPTKNELDPSSPSIAEALAAMGSYTLLISAQDAPLLHFWNYSKSIHVLKDPQYESFSASVRTQQYASGGTQKWQGIFYVVLAMVFVTNLFCLSYAVIRTGLVTDFTEPENLFSLAINSPPSRRLAGSCGGGPSGGQFKVNWFINLDGEHVYIESGEEPPGWKGKAGLDHDRLSSIYTKLARSQSSFP